MGLSTTHVVNLQAKDAAVGCVVIHGDTHLTHKQASPVICLLYTIPQPLQDNLYCLLVYLLLSGLRAVFTACKQ